MGIQTYPICSLSQVVGDSRESNYPPKTPMRQACVKLMSGLGGNFWTQVHLGIMWGSTGHIYAISGQLAFSCRPQKIQLEPRPQCPNSAKVRRRSGPKMMASAVQQSCWVNVAFSLGCWRPGLRVPLREACPIDSPTYSIDFQHIPLIFQDMPLIFKHILIIFQRIPFMFQHISSIFQNIPSICLPIPFSLQHIQLIFQDIPSMFQHIPFVF